jgi:hypothetical protein
MSLDNAPILVMCWDAPTAHALVNVISAARGDVVYAANTGEAMQRLQQFSLNAAVLCWQKGADTVAAALRVSCGSASEWRAFLHVRIACEWYCGNSQRSGRHRYGSSGACPRDAIDVVAGRYSRASPSRYVQRAAGRRHGMEWAQYEGDMSCERVGI